mmetsp:Transcript_6936/g.7104  ORF Transcript_6936/g.7104 Transcript_6936/m.7104 type:complete len:138 (+) Transcript_6936:97-510(+)
MPSHPQGPREEQSGEPFDGKRIRVERHPRGAGHADSAKMVFLDMNLQRHRMAMGVQVIVKDPEEIEKFKQREIDITKEHIHKILDTGVKVVLTTKGADELCMKYFVEGGGVLRATVQPRGSMAVGQGHRWEAVHHHG